MPPPPKKRSHHLETCILVASTAIIMRICCCHEVFLFDRRYGYEKVYWPSNIYIQDYWRDAVIWLQSLCVTGFMLPKFIVMVIKIIFHHSQSLCVAVLQWRMIIVDAVAITLRDWLLKIHRTSLLSFIRSKSLCVMNVPAVLMLCSSLLFTAARCNICHHVSSWMLIH